MSTFKWLRQQDRQLIRKKHLVASKIVLLQAILLAFYHRHGRLTIINHPCDESSCWSGIRIDSTAGWDRTSLRCFLQGPFVLMHLINLLAGHKFMAAKSIGVGESWVDLGPVPGCIRVKPLYLVGGAISPSWKMMEFVNGKDDIPCIVENKKCSKPPTRYHDYYIITSQFITLTELTEWRLEI
jgi:hypothetical protein